MLPEDDKGDALHRMGAEVKAHNMRFMHELRMAPSNYKGDTRWF